MNMAHRPGGLVDGAEADLDALALAAAGGDRAALDQLLSIVDRERLARPAIRRVIVNDSDVDDVNQDVLIRLSQRVGSFRGEAKFTTWLFTLARNAAVDHLRRQHDHEELEPDDRLSVAERVSSMIATRSDVHAAVDALPEHYRDALRLRDIDGLAYGEIAARLDIELNTVRSRIARGRALVASTLAPLGETGPPGSAEGIGEPGAGQGQRG